jgi:cellulose synthase/poly-beta-1,6-N-acetylglucosamine synthase-like glycosyltransferase
MTPQQRRSYWMISGALALAWTAFLVYWLNFERRPSNFSVDRQPNVFDVTMFVGLSFVLLMPIFMLTLGWIVTGLLQRNAETPIPTTLPDPTTTRVAFITTYVPGSEPIGMLSRTLEAIKAVDYPHDTWVLDEGDDADVRTLCAQLGVHYFTRKGIARYNELGSKFSPKSKGGNHNAWYDAHGLEKYDIVAQIDTDFVPHRDFLTKTLPYFEDSDVAFVGTPQVYGNMDNFIARGAAEQTYGFYGPFLRGLSAIDSTMLIGANHVIRVAALKEVGLYNPHLTEDLATGILLHSNGWKSKYVAETLAIGEGPDTWSAFFKQQFRWAKGCNDLLFTRTFSAIRGMKPLQGVLYTWVQLYYLTGAAYGVGLLLLGLYFCFGWQAAHVETVPFLVAYVPLLLVFEAAMFWTQRFNIRPDVERGAYFRGRLLMIAVMPVFLAAFVTAVRDRDKHTEFEVTPKGGVTLHVTVKKVKKGKNPYKAHMAVVSFTSLSLFVGLMSNRIEAMYIAWTVLTFVSALAIAMNPSWPSFQVLLSQYGRTQIASFKQQLNKPFEWQGSSTLDTNVLVSVPAGQIDLALPYREEEHDVLPSLKRGRRARIS